MVDFNSDRINRIRSARTVKDITTQVDAIKAQIASLSKTEVGSAPNHLKISISAGVGKTIEVGNMIPTSAPKRPLTKNVDLGKLLGGATLGNLRGRAVAAGNQNSMVQAYQELGIAYQVLQSKALGGTSEATRKTALDAIRSLMGEVTDIINTYRKQSAVPKDEIPDEVMDLAKKLFNTVKKVVADSAVSRVTAPEYYVAKHGMEPGSTGKAEDTITYQAFIRLDNFTNDENVVYHNYAVVLTTEVGTETGSIRYYLTTLTNAMAPGTFPIGKEIQGADQLVSRLNELLAIDGADTFKPTRVPLNTTTKAIKDLTGFGITTHTIRGRKVLLIDNVRIKNDKLWVRLAVGLSNADKQNALNEALSMFGIVFRSTVGKIKKTDITYKFVQSRAPASSGVREFIVLSLVSSRGVRRGLQMNQKLAKLAQELDLTSGQMAKVAQALK